VPPIALTRQELVRTVSVPAAVRTLISNPNRSMCAISASSTAPTAENASSWPSHPPRPLILRLNSLAEPNKIYRLETAMPDARDMAFELQPRSVAVVEMRPNGVAHPQAFTA
jgi:hypothetical protein